MHLELALVILLVVLMYQKSHLLNNLVASPLAKLLLLAGVVAITHCYGRNAGIISALISLLLFHNMFEGMESKGDDDESSDNKESFSFDEDKSSDSDSDADSDADSDDDSKKKKSSKKKSSKKESGVKKVIKDIEDIFEPMNVKDKTDMEEEMRNPKDSNKDTQGVGANPQLADNQQDPLAMPSKTKESFTLLN